MAELNAKVKVGVEGTDAVNKLSNSVQNLSKDLGDFASGAGGFSNVLGSITGKLGPVGLAATAAGAAFAALGMRAIQVADQISDISDATGISAGSLLNFKQSIIEAGGGIDDFTTLATKFNQVVGDAATGNDRAQKTFQKLGVFVTDAGGKVRDTESIMRDAISAIAGIDDNSSRAAMAVDLFGKSAAKLDFTKLNAFADPIKDAQIQKLADYQSAIDRVRNRLETGLVSFFGSIAVEIDRAMDKMAEAEKKANESGRTFGDLFERMAMARGGGVNPLGIGGPAGTRPMTEREQRRAFEEQQARLMAPYKTRAGVPEATTGGFGAPSESAIKAAAESAKRIAQAQADAAKYASLRGANDIQKIEVNSAAEIARARIDIFAQEHLSDAQKTAEFAAKRREIELKTANEIAAARISLAQKSYAVEQEQRDEAARAQADQEAAWDRARVAASDIAQEQNRITEAMTRRYEFDLTLAGLGERQVKNAEGLFQLEEDRLQTLRAIALIKDLPYEERLAQEKNINNIFDERRKKLAEQQAQNDSVNRSFMTGWNRAMADYLDSTTNAATQAQRIFEESTRGMEDAIVNFAKTGKFEFKSLINSILETLLRSQVQQMIGKIFNLGNTSTASSGGLFGGKIIPGILAGGGPVANNRPYIVGEQGPELFLPNSAGTMIPNRDIMGSTSVTYNISAVDAASFRALIARDPGFIHAVASAGARTQPLTRK